MTPQLVLAAARLLVCERAPYLASAVHQLVFREAPGLKTFGTSKNWICRWDPEVAVGWGVEGTAAVVVHEIFHLLQEHWARFPSPQFEQQVANIAGDLAINPDVREMGFKLPDTEVWPRTLKLDEHKTAEFYYAQLMKRAKISKVRACGGCAGNPVEGEPGDGDDEGRTEAEARKTRAQVARAIQSAQRGTVPGGLVRWADDALAPPKIPWREKLSRVCRAAVAYRPGSDYSTYARLSRRQAAVGFGPGRPVLPSVRGSQVRVTLLVDTSGSVSAEDLTTVLSEAQGILQVCGAALDIVVCDADVQGTGRVRSVKEVCALLKGGGGSDFRPAFALIEKQRPRCNIVVAATDGHIAVPDRQPFGMRVIWLLVGWSPEAPCDWGTAVVVE